MAGSKIGGLRAAATNKRLYGANFYIVQGAKGGRAGRGGGFASTNVGSDGLTGQERARIVGQIGGQRSRRHKEYAQT